MFELSPYRHVHPPHLDNNLRSSRGEFRLIELEGGRTRLEGRTWYRCEMYPQWYWTAWSDLLIHKIHERVLEHIRAISEQEGLRGKVAHAEARRSRRENTKGTKSTKKEGSY
jgi:hypothetical protein